jgi:hypothetical protein
MDILFRRGALAVERDTMRTTLHEWNEQNAGRYRLMFQPVMWELNVRPQLGGRPQEIINQQLRDRDMVLAAFWTRIGTPTGMDLSGTVEEIRRCRDEGKDVLLYFSKRPVPVDTLDMDQLTQVRAFETLCHEQGITGEFDSPDDLRSKLMRHLTQFADEVTSGNSSPLVNAPAQSGAAAGASAAPGERRLQQEENLRESWHLLKLALGRF